MEDLKKYLKEHEGYEYLREIPNKGLCGVKRYLFTWALAYEIEALTYGGRYCYPSFDEALIALASWDGDGDPKDDIWIKHKGRGIDCTNPKKEILSNFQHRVCLVSNQVHSFHTTYGNQFLGLKPASHRDRREMPSPLFQVVLIHLAFGYKRHGAASSLRLP